MTGTGALATGDEELGAAIAQAHDRAQRQTAQAVTLALRRRSWLNRVLAVAALAASAGRPFPLAAAPLPVVTQRMLRKEGPRGRWHFAYSYPQIHVRGALMGVQGITRSFNHRMRREAEASLAGFKKDLAANASLPAPVKAKSVRTVENTVVTRGPGLLAFKFTQFQYLTGQAHPFTRVFTLNFELRGGFVRLADLFAPRSDYLRQIAAAVQGSVTAQAQKGRFQIIEPRGYAARAENFENFVITRGGLEFFLNPYQVAPGYVGLLTAVVPWSTLEQDLSERARWIRRHELQRAG